MTHDERILLCMVARAVAEDNAQAAVAIRKLVKRIQRHASIESNKRDFDLAHEVLGGEFVRERRRRNGLAQR